MQRIKIIPVMDKTKYGIWLYMVVKRISMIPTKKMLPISTIQNDNVIVVYVG